MFNHKRIRDEQEVYCFCRNEADIVCFNEQFESFTIVTDNGNKLNNSIFLNELQKEKVATIYVASNFDKNRLSKEFASVININEKDTLPCHKYLLSINSFGDIYPCCRQITNSLIGNIRDSDIIYKITNYKSKINCECCIGRLSTHTFIDHILHINIELGGFCNGKCVYCFQRNLPTFNKRIEFYEQLKMLVNQLRPKSIMLFGGEVGVQPETIDLFENLVKEQQIQLSIATNGDFPESTMERLSSFVSSFQITFNGFSKDTVKAVSNINFTQQLVTIEGLLNHNIISVKFLINPLNILEIPMFLKWACTKPFNHIIIDVTVITPEDYTGTDNWGESMLSYTPLFWQRVFDSISADVRCIIKENVDLLLQNQVALLICPEISKHIGLDYDFYKSLGLTHNLFAKSVDISTKAWRTLL